MKSIVIQIEQNKKEKFRIVKNRIEKKTGEHTECKNVTQEKTKETIIYEKQIENKRTENN